MATHENESLVQELYHQWNSGAIDFDRLVHPEIANHQPEREPEIGREAFRMAIEGVMQAVPDSSWTTLRIFAAADLVLCHNRWSGTWNGTVFAVSLPHQAGTSPSSTCMSTGSEIASSSNIGWCATISR